MVAAALLADVVVYIIAFWDALGGQPGLRPAGCSPWLATSMASTPTHWSAWLRHCRRLGFAVSPCTYTLASMVASLRAGWPHCVTMVASCSTSSKSGMWTLVEVSRGCVRPAGAPFSVGDLGFLYATVDDPRDTLESRRLLGGARSILLRCLVTFYLLFLGIFCFIVGSCRGLWHLGLHRLLLLHRWPLPLQVPHQGLCG